MNPTLRAFLWASLFGCSVVALVVGVVAWLTWVDRRQP